MKSRHPATVQQLAQIVVAESGLSEEDVVQIVKGMASDGALVLQKPLRVMESPWDYFLTPTLSLWFWIALGATVIAANIVVFIPPNIFFFPLVVTRWFSGALLILFLPGYALLQLLFQGAIRKGFLEQFVLSIGLSLATVPLIGLLLTYTLWGLSFVPVTISIAVFTVILLAAAVGRESRRVRLESTQA